MTRIEEEKSTIEKMISLYCRKKEGNIKMCHSCLELLNYAHARLEKCKFGNKKGTCQKCPVHCYKPDMRERVRTIMRWSGPRMIIYHPIAAVKHLIKNRRDNKG